MHGTATTLSAAAGDGMSVLVFYRGAWCPYCNIALSAYQEQLLPQLTERGIRLVAISPQKPDGSLTMQQKHEPRLHRCLRPGQRHRRAARHPHPSLPGGPRRPAAAADST